MTREQRAKLANDQIEWAIVELIKKFKETPTIFLEEKHLHNEFDRFLREKVEKGEQYITLNMRVSKNSEKKAIIVCPLIMNEYTTVNHYKRSESFIDTQNIPKEGSPGSLDYVYIDKEWIKKNDYISFVNKDAESRKSYQVDNLSKERFLVTVEFKHLHLDSFMKSYDEIGKATSEYSIDSAIKTIISGIDMDFNKQRNEGAPYFHILYFNTKIPINMNSIKKLEDSLIKITNEKRDLLSNFSIWYVQGGAPFRFDKNDDLGNIYLKFTNTKSEVESISL